MLVLDVVIMIKLILCVRYFIRHKQMKLAMEENRGLSLRQRLNFSLIYVLGSL